MSVETSINAQKQAFLRTQIRRLGAPLVLPSTNSSIPAATLERIVESTNKKITAFNRHIFSIQAQSHVAEQLGSLYLTDALADGLPSRKAETCVKHDIDLTHSKNGVRAIAPLWADVVLDDSGRVSKRRRLTEEHESIADVEAPRVDEEEGDNGNLDDGEYYEQLHVRLSAQIDRRDQLRRKLEHLKRLQALLEPFEDPKVNIQPNLVTKDNTELESELSRMRILMAKVGGGLQRRKLQADPGERIEHSSMIQDNKARLDELLNL